MRAAFARFREAFPYAPLDCHYPVVCNKNPYLIRVLRDMGAGVHANTPGDAFAALAAGVPADRIVYSGTNLDAEDMRFLVERGIHLHVDSLDQLRDLVRRHAPPAAGLRLLIDDAARGNRIGVTPDGLPEAAAWWDGEARRLNGEAEVSVFLSGGLDSSAVAWLLREAGAKVRVPLFNRALAAASFTLPTSMKLHGACEKYVLKLAMLEPWLPGVIDA